MHTIAIVEIELTNNRRRGTARRSTGVRALIRAAELDGPYGVVLYPTVNGRLDESRPEVLSGSWDDLGDADRAAREALHARKRAGS